MQTEFKIQKAEYNFSTDDSLLSAKYKKNPSNMGKKKAFIFNFSSNAFQMC